MLTKLRSILNQKGQGIVEYVLLLAFVAAIAWMLNNSNLSDTLIRTYDTVVAFLNGETPTEVSGGKAFDLALYRKQGKNLLHDYANNKDLVDDELRVKADQQALANIGIFFVGLTREQVRSEIGYTQGEILLADYVDTTEAGSGDVDVQFNNDKTKGHLDNWMLGDYGDNGVYDDDVSSSKYSSDTRYLLSNSMIEHRDAAALAATDNNGWGNNRSIRVQFTYASSTGGAPTGTNSDVVTGVRVRVNRGDSKKAGTHYYEYDVTVNSDATWSQTEPGKSGKY